MTSGVVRRISIASYEAEINLVIHSDGGQMELVVDENEITLLVTDIGPGIPDIDRAMQEGYSTASEDARMMGFGAGMGLSNMARNADTFDIESKVGEGTKIRMVFALYKKNGYDEKEKEKIEVLVDFILGHVRELEKEIKESKSRFKLEPINAMNNLTRIYWDLEKELCSNLPDEPEVLEKVKKAYANFIRRKTNKIPEEA